MRKPGRRSIFSKLPDEQRAHLDALLFNEDRSYAEVLEVVRRDFGLKTSDTALRRYYQQRAREKMTEAIASAAAAPIVCASGVEVTIICKRPGEISLAIRPLH